jgi:hypothetical protein
LRAERNAGLLLLVFGAMCVVGCGLQRRWPGWGDRPQWGLSVMPRWVDPFCDGCV